MQVFDKKDIHYEAIKQFYGDKRAKRSGVPYINHIDEGLYILDRINADAAAKAAYCIHPLFQGDAELKEARTVVEKFDKWVLVLVMEYRNIANAYLSQRRIQSLEEIQLSPLKEVNDMLIADKIQNRKDFELYHKGRHPRSTDLDRYFKLWLTKLGVSESFYDDMIVQLNHL